MIRKAVRVHLCVLLENTVVSFLQLPVTPKLFLFKLSGGEMILIISCCVNSVNGIVTSTDRGKIQPGGPYMVY